MRNKTWPPYSNQMTMNKEEERRNKKYSGEKKSVSHWFGLKKTKIENKIAQNRGRLKTKIQIQKKCNNSRRNVIFPQFFLIFLGDSFLFLLREIPVCRDQKEQKKTNRTNDDVHYNVLFDSIRARKFLSRGCRGFTLYDSFCFVEKKNVTKKVRTSLRSHRSYNPNI